MGAHTKQARQHFETLSPRTTRHLSAYCRRSTNTYPDRVRNQRWPCKSVDDSRVAHSFSSESPNRGPAGEGTWVVWRANPAGHYLNQADRARRACRHCHPPSTPHPSYTRPAGVRYAVMWCTLTSLNLRRRSGCVGRLAGRAGRPLPRPGPPAAARRAAAAVHRRPGRGSARTVCKLCPAEARAGGCGCAAACAGPLHGRR